MSAAVSLPESEPRGRGIRCNTPKVHPCPAKPRGRHARHWTSHEEDRLRMSWGVHEIAHIANELGRTPYAIYLKASELGLGLGCPQGFEHIATSAKRTGYAPATLLKILHWARVRTRAAASHPDGPTYRLIVDPSDVDEAARKWCSMETVRDAARRAGWQHERLRRAVLDAIASGELSVIDGHGHRRQWRLAPADVDRIVAARSGPTESIRAAAARTGHSIATLRAWVVEAGIERRGFWNLSPETYDRLVAEKLAQRGKPFRKRKKGTL